VPQSADRESLGTTSDTFPLSDPDSPSTVITEPSLEELPVTFMKPPTEPPRDRWNPLPRRPQEADSPSTTTTELPSEELPATSVKHSTEPPPDRWGTLSRRPQEVLVLDDLEEFQHVAQNFRPPPRTLPPPRRRPFQSFKEKLRGFWGRLRLPHGH
jgi:hypothetical protein